MALRYSDNLGDALRFGIRQTLGDAVDAPVSESEIMVSGTRKPELENAAAGAWIKHYFPDQFGRPFTFYQKDFWNWVNGVQPDAKSRPRIECEPRGVGKSTSARGAVVKLLAERKKNYILYICATDNQAQKHFSAIRLMLEAQKLLADYPHLSPRPQKHRPNVAASWSSDRLVTKAGQVVEFISLLGNARGFTTEEGKRPDVFVLDDIDDSKDTPYFTNKKLEILKYSILPARGDNTLILFPQNLIHRDSICQQVRDQRADILSDRIFVGPYPLCKRYEAKKVDMKDGTGAKEWVITYYEPLDDAISKEYCTELLNESGKDSFDSECQQMVFKVGDDKDFREWNELYHVITYSEFRAFFEQYNIPVWNEKTNHPQIPHNWNVGIGLDWGTTVGHPSAVSAIARPNQACPLNDCFFSFTEIILPKFPLAAGEEVPLVSPGRVALAIKQGLAEWNVSEAQIKRRIMSHEASAALNTMKVDLKPELKLYFGKWKAEKGSGVAQIQSLLEIDYSKKHPFRPFKGYTRQFFVVPDEQGAIIRGALGQDYVAQPYNYKGFARARYEIPLYSHKNGGQNKKEDDYVDAYRGLMNKFGVNSEDLTDEERYKTYLSATAPENLPENIAKVDDDDLQSILIASARENRRQWERRHNQPPTLPGDDFNEWDKRTEDAGSNYDDNFGQEFWEL